MSHLSVFLQAYISVLPNLVGFIMPVIVQLFTTRLQKESERYFVSIVLCFLVAALIDWDKLLYGNPQQVLASAGIIFLEMDLMYTRYFSTSGIRFDLIRLLGGTNQLQEPMIKVPALPDVTQPEQGTE